MDLLKLIKYFTGHQWLCLLNRYGDLQAFFGSNEMIEIFGVVIDIDFDSAHVTVELLDLRIIRGQIGRASCRERV